MTKSLRERLQDAKGILLRANGEIARLPAKLPTEVGNEFQSVLALECEIEHWIGIIEARTAALNILKDLETQADADDQVPFGQSRILFQHARLLGVQAYLATEWALADRLTGMVGRILCVKNSWGDPKHPPQLVSQFIMDGSKKNTAAMLFTSMREAFGWPISVSYALRNHFVHDGALLNGASFFEGPDSQSAFRISRDGWTHVESTASGYGADPGQHRAGVAWPASPRDDLRAVLDACEHEVDDALGVLVLSACHALGYHIACMLGTD